jgi:two-component system KDP operon response regulator KdpE
MPSAAISGPAIDAVAKVWGSGQPHDLAKLRVFMNQLRRKIEDDPAQPRYIVTEPGVGYRFRGDPEEMTG